eukprot:2166245-Pleurochrysis_carterae.AAC.3
MANATDVPQLQSVARCLRAAYAPASMQALRSGALGPLPLPHPSRSRLHPLVRFRAAPHGLRGGEFLPPRATNKTALTKEVTRSPQTSPPRVEPSTVGHAPFFHFGSALLIACN